MRALSLDLATETGWASGDTLIGEPKFGLWRGPSTGVELGPFLTSFAQWLNGKCVEDEIEIIIFEEPIMPNGMTNLQTLLKLYNLVGTAERVAHHRKIPVRQVAAGTWKKSFCGKAGFGKSAKPYPPIMKCREYGWQVSNHNVADGLGIWVHACRILSPKAAERFDPLFRAAA